MDLVIDDVRHFCATASNVSPPVNEAETEAQIVLPLLRLLGWSRDGQGAIRRQVATHTLFADIQLIFDSRPLCVIEVKRAQTDLFTSGRDPRKSVIASLTRHGRAAFDQVLGYAISDGIPFAWITNGAQHLVFRVQQHYVPIESRLIFVAREPSDLVTRFEEFQRLAPSELHRLHLAESPIVSGTATLQSRSIQQASYDELVSHCAAASTRQLSVLADPPAPIHVRLRPVRKYSPSTFVTRPQYDETFDDFWRSRSPVLMFSGEAGVGKTSMLCHFAETIQNRVGAVPFLFRDGFQVANGLRDTLHQALSNFTRLQPPDDLESAIECVEDYVLSLAPFRDVLNPKDGSGSKRNRQLNMLQSLLPNTFAADDNVITETIHRLTDSSNTVLIGTIQSLLRWTADQTTDEKIATHLLFVAAAPLPKSTSTFRSILPGHARPVKQYASETVSAMKREQPELWQWFLKAWDSSTISAFDALAMLSAYRTSPDVTNAERLKRESREAWLGPILDALVKATPDRFLNAPQPTRQAFIRLLAASTVPKLLLFVDAINESPAPNLLSSDLLAVAQQMTGRLAKLVVSCRTPDVRFFDFDAFHQVRFDPNRETTAISAFSNLEFSAAWNHYREAYGITGVIGAALKELCRNPLILRLMCEGFAGGLVPEDDVRLIEIFDAYWNRKIEQGADGRARAIVVQRLADIAQEYARDTSEGEPAVVPLARCNDLIIGGATILNSLISEAVVVFLSPTTLGRSGVRFMYESFHEYVLARNLRDRHGHGLRDALDGYIDRAKGDRLLRGALVYILLWLDQQEIDVSEWVARMYKRGFHSDAVSLAAKLRMTSATITIVQWLRSKPLSRDHVAVLARALAKHVRAASPGIFGDAVGAALYDARLAVPATAFALDLLKGSQTALQPHVQALVLGFRWIWATGVRAEELPKIDVKQLLYGDRRARRVIEVGLWLSSERRVGIPEWASELEALQTVSLIASAIVRCIKDVALEMLFGAGDDLGIPTHSEAVIAWMEFIQQTAPHSARDFRWKHIRDTALRYMSGSGATMAGRRLIVLDVLGDDESLFHHLSSGSNIVALLVARVFRLLTRCRSLPTRIAQSESIEDPHIVLTTVVSALLELATLLTSEKESDTALLWLEHLRETCLEAVDHELTALDHRQKSLRCDLREIWREMLSVGGEITCDILSTTVAPVR